MTRAKNQATNSLTSIRCIVLEQIKSTPRKAPHYSFFKKKAGRPIAEDKSGGLEGGGQVVSRQSLHEISSNSVRGLLDSSPDRERDDGQLIVQGSGGSANDPNGQ